MTTVNMNTPLREGAEAVRVGVILTPIPDGKDCVGISKEGHSVDYKSGKDEETKSFCFDQVVTTDNIQSLHPELLQPLTESMPGGYNGALLICGASTDHISTLIDHSVIKQVLANVFSRMLSKEEEELFVSVSFLQFHPEGTAVDLLSPSRQTRKLTTHPVLGNLVGDLCEVCVSSAEEAYSLYETCRETLKASAGSIYRRCSSVFSVTVEWKPRPEEVEGEVFRCTLQLFSLAGGASRTDLRGVTPLVRALDQIQLEDTTSVKLLDFLLNNALRGNSRTFLIYCIQPQGPLGDETPSALALAQKARRLVTEATRDHWCPRAAEQEIRCSIMDQRTRMMSEPEGENEFHNTCRLAELTQNLQIVKNQSWEKRREKSKTIKDKTQSHQSRNGNWHSGDHRELADKGKYLRDLLKQEMEEHIRDGKGDVMDVQKRVARIQQLREALRAETLMNGAAPDKSDLYQQSQREYDEAQERRRRLREDCQRLIQEEVERIEGDLAQELTEGPQRELLVLTRERQVLVLQIEALRTEAQQAERDLQNQYRRHQTELQRLREESLLVFGVFHQVSEEQRKMSEGRYRSVLLEAVHDAVYLSAQNQQLQADNKQLRKALGKLKDTLAAQGGYQG